MKYILPSPEQYMNRLLKEFVIARVTGLETKSRNLHNQMAEFSNAMAKIESYHIKRKNGK